MADEEMKVFDFTDDEEDIKPPIPFVIKYQRKQYTGEGADRKPTGKWETLEEKFSAKSAVPAGLTMSTLAAFSNRGSIASAAVLDFMRRALVDEDGLRFMTLIDDDDVKVKMKNLAAITDWLLTEYGERPTQSA